MAVEPFPTKHAIIPAPFAGFAEGDYAAYALMPYVILPDPLFDLDFYVWFNEENNIMYFSTNSLGTYDLWRFNLLTGAYNLLVADDYDRFYSKPQASLLARYIVFVDESGGFQYVTRVFRNAVQIWNVTPPLGFNFYGAFISPSGKWLVLVSYTAHTVRVYQGV